MFELARRNNHHVESYNPFREMEEFEKKFFANPFAGFFEAPALAEFKTDVADEGDHYLLEADLPGFEKKDIHLDVNGDVLRVHAERHSRFGRIRKRLHASGPIIKRGEICSAS